ncbi:MAG: nucleotidyltransferase family protein [Burkholderiales bacterium]
MRPSEILKNKREEILALAAKAGARNVRVFGSVARGDDGEESDLDLLVDWTPQTSMFDVGGLVADLQALVGRRVDVISPRQLHPRFRPAVLAQARPI